jgi:hypothetical protein
MEIENIDFFNVDANWDPDIDDMTLSQICTYIEKEHMAHETYYIGNNGICIDTAWVGQN